MTLNKTRRFLVCVVALLLTLTVATNWFVSIVTPARAVVTEALLGSYTIVACLLGRMGVFAVNDMSEAESISISRRVYNLFPDTERQLIDSHIPELGFVGQEITFARYEFNTLANKIKSIFGDGNYVETYTPVDPVYISTEQTPILFKDFISPGINVVRDAQVTDNTSVINLVNPKYIFYSDIAVNESFITSLIILFLVPNEYHLLNRIILFAYLFLMAIIYCIILVGIMIMLLFILGIVMTSSEYCSSNNHLCNFVP